MKGLKRKAINAVKWNTLSKFSQYFLKFTLGVLLARLLSPEEFGLIALITVITELSNFIINGGFSASLIQNKNIDNKDYSTVFYINVGIGLLVTLLFFFGAPLFVMFYNEPRLESIARVLSFTYILNSLTVVQKAYFIRGINFKRISIIDIIVQTSCGLFGIALAFLGFGYWTLVWKRIFEAFTQTGLYFYFSGWKPDLYFSKEIFRKHWSFSNKTLMSNFFRQVSDRIDLIVVGKFFNASDLGVFQRGKSNAFLPVHFTSEVINRILFPVFSKLQDNKKKFLDNYVKIYRMVTLFIMPVNALLLITAKEFILLLLGEKWETVIPFLQLFSLAGFLYLMTAGKPNMLNALGYPKYIMKFNAFEVIAKPILIIGLVIFADANMPVIALVFISFFLLRFLYSSLHISRKLNVSFCKIAFSNYRELWIIILSSIAGYLSVHFVSIDSNFFSFSFKFFVFAIIYSVLVYLFAKEIFIEAKFFFFNKTT